ncbi:uncharacterized protein LOC100906803 [Galendromus occidentalis]|uniref:Uncharacterized protein LOC100906803 n=1 Tax=Galendromus occidentalis TaxID=34638 RepID=A0AAJ7WHY2_9ACAR|nr:uncharacterized protein LOC100906803 [Galendromus occidentalis]
MAMAEESVDQEERIVMTPRKKGVGHTCIAVERLKQVDTSKAVHVAGGQHQGIIINKENQIANGADEVPQLWLEFKVFLKNASDNTHSQESRLLKFWFKEGTTEKTQMHLAQDFFKELVSPCEFPRDYVGFIKKIMKLLQNRYPDMRKVEVELKQLETQTDQNSISDSSSLVGLLEESRVESTTITIERVLEIIERAYPNAVSIEDIAKDSVTQEETVRAFISELTSRGVIRPTEDGSLFTRVTRDEHKVKRVRQMPAVTRQQQPTIAIITAQFCEKVAVDAMISDKNTFVRFKTEGESNVYTLGNIGCHRVVATKLPAVGHQRGAMIAAGNTTTRLLGTFQNVDHVILVGCGGGVPHFTDHTKHVRLGDVVVSDKPAGIDRNNYIYMFAEKIKTSPNEDRSPSPPGSFNLKTWLPPEDKLQRAAHRVIEENVAWEDYIAEGFKQLQKTAAHSDEENDFMRPPDESDKLFMGIGGNDVIEVGHPCAPPGAANSRVPGHPSVHFGAVASGGMVALDDAQRQEFASQHGILAFDSEFNSVVESVYGNRKDNYLVLRGVADYRDGTKRKDWQAYSALVAAAYMRAVVENLY